MVLRSEFATSGWNGMGATTPFRIQYGTARPAISARPSRSQSVLKNTRAISDCGTFAASSRTTGLPSCRYLFSSAEGRRPGHGFSNWVSFGVRPEVFFTKYLSLAFEAGFDHTDGFATTQNGNSQFEGWLRKFTIAPQIGAGSKFFSRPVFRVFMTYANWSDGFRGFVGGIPFEDRTDGLTYGVQAETWW